MILLTGGGSIANAFSQLYPCKIISARFVNDEILASNIEAADVIIHNAAIIKCDELSTYIDSNFGLTKRILEIAKDVKPSVKFINISTMSLLEQDKNYLNPAEMTDYAFSKYISELYCLRHSLESICNVRFSTIFYGDPNKDGLSKLAYDGIVTNKILIYNNGEALRDFIPVDIAVKYLYKLIQTDILPKKINIVSGRATSFNHFVNKIVAINPKVEIVNMICETKSVLCDFSKEGIYQLGEIQFSMDKLFEEYIIKLNEDFNL